MPSVAKRPDGLVERCRVINGKNATSMVAHSERFKPKLMPRLLRHPSAEKRAIRSAR